MSLKDHKKIGKRLVTPLNQIGMSEIGYTRDIFPQIMWIGLLAERYGNIETANLCVRFAQIAKEIKSDGKGTNYSICQAYNSLDETQKGSIVGALTAEGLIEKLREGLAPLLLLYEGFPLAFLGPPDTSYSSDLLVNRLSECIEKYINKNQPLGVYMQAVSVFVHVATGGLKYFSSVKVPNFKELIERPESELAQEDAGRIRSTLLTEKASIEAMPGDNWPMQFWNQGPKISPCDPI